MRLFTIQIIRDYNMRQTPSTTVDIFWAAYTNNVRSLDALLLKDPNLINATYHDSCGGVSQIAAIVADVVKQTIAWCGYGIMVIGLATTPIAPPAIGAAAVFGSVSYGISTVCD